MSTLRPLPGPEIYDGILKLDLPNDVQGWHSTHPVFKRLIDELKPATIIECGSWKGASIIHMAGLAPNARLYACDTWLGGIDHEVTQETPTSVLQRERGYPVLYQQFLFNVAKAEQQRRIVPVIQTSLNAARLLKAHQIQCELAYIDGSHEGMDPFFDIKEYWPLVRRGGVMFGDDLGWPDVKASVFRWLCETKLWHRLEVVDDNFWIIRKP